MFYEKVLSFVNKSAIFKAICLFHYITFAKAYTYIFVTSFIFIQIFSVYNKYKCICTFLWDAFYLGEPLQVSKIVPIRIAFMLKLNGSIDNILVYYFTPVFSNPS